MLGLGLNYIKLTEIFNGMAWFFGDKINPLTYLFLCKLENVNDI